MKRGFWIAAVLVFVFSATAATVHIDPANSTVLPGGAFDVAVQLMDVTDLYAYQFDISFDPTVVSALSVMEAGFLQGGGSTFFFPGAIDNVLGTVTLTAGSLQGAVSGVGGTGALTMLRFQGIGLGTSAIGLSNVVLLDSASGEIAATIRSGSVDVVIPEPAPAPLIALGVIAGMVARKCGCIHRLWPSKPNRQR